jgi:hypothetical protein
LIAVEVFQVEVIVYAEASEEVLVADVLVVVGVLLGLWLRLLLRFLFSGTCGLFSCAVAGAWLAISAIVFEYDYSLPFETNMLSFFTVLLLFFHSLLLLIAFFTVLVVLILLCNALHGLFLVFGGLKGPKYFPILLNLIQQVTPVLVVELGHFGVHVSE